MPGSMKASRHPPSKGALGASQRSIEGGQNFMAVLSDSSDNGEGDDYVDMKSLVPLNQSPESSIGISKSSA